jgi:hypothetical protein
VDIIGAVDDASERVLNRCIADQTLEAVASNEMLVTRHLAFFEASWRLVPASYQDCV